MPLTRTQSSGTWSLLSRSRDPGISGYRPIIRGSLPPATFDNPGLFVRQPVSSLGADLALGVVARRDAASQPADALELAPPEVSINDLARNYVTARRAEFIDQAWQKFKAGEYRAATDVFGLADSLALDDPSARVDILLGKMLSAFASRQYALASNSLKYMLTPNQRTGELPDPSFLNKLPELIERYGKRTDFREQLNSLSLETSAIAISKVAERQALRATMLWANKDSGNALFHAKKIDSEKDAPWTSLALVMDRASRVASPDANTTSKPAELTSPLLPADLVAHQ